MKKAAALDGAFCGAVIALGLTACFNLANIGNKNDSGDDSGDDSLVGIQIDIGNGGSALKSLSSDLAERYVNYLEVIFVDTKDTGDISRPDTAFYRVAGYINQKIKMKR